ncbi:MAG: type II toxin-antitoxin system RelE/ParE family toxin [Nanoarchaeales archaeon]|nr:type II toxin-antitoxin system RelE/ParE family toxin [Nanoarchaeales archaeon]
MNNLIITNLAKSDIREIRIYHNKHSKDYSKLLINKIKSSSHNLKQFPNIGSDCDFYRELPCGNYNILYVVEENNIYIIRVIHSSMNFNFY